MSGPCEYCLNDPCDCTIDADALATAMLAHPNGPRIGELFSGYGGLGHGVQSVYGGTIAWHSDIDKGACKILAHRYPGVPNLGDITTVEWVPTCGAYEFEGCGQRAEVLPDRSGWQCHRCQKLWPTSLGKVYWPHIPEPVDILTGGSPCQDLSHAGRRAGMTEGTRSNLWVAMREAIAQLRPAVVVWENVRGAYSAEATSDLESCPGCMGDPRHRGPVLRALGRVLGDLSDLGYDCRWHGLRAADVGAPHGRFRVFVVATDAKRGRRDGWTFDALGQSLRRVAAAGSGEDARLLPPSCSDTNGAGAHGDGGLDLRTAVSLLLPTPAVNDMGEGKSVDHWDEWTATMQAKHGNGNGHGKSLAIEAQRLLPTPRVTTGGSIASQSRVQEVLDGAVKETADCRLGLTAEVLAHRGEAWGDYAPAIARWETVFGRPAPAPTTTSTKGNPQLSPAFVEWMMGLPEGWVDDVPGLTRNEKLKALGNGVVAQQCAEALRVMAAWEVAA